MDRIGEIIFNELMVIGRIDPATNDMTFRKENSGKYIDGLYGIYKYITQSSTSKKIIHIIVQSCKFESVLNNYEEIYLDSFTCTGYIGLCPENSNHNYIRYCSQDKNGIGIVSNKLLISTKREEHIVKIFVRRKEDKVISIRFQYLEE